MGSVSETVSPTEGDAGVVDLRWTNKRINEPVLKLRKLTKPLESKKKARNWGIGLGAAGTLGVGAGLFIPGLNIVAGGIVLGEAIAAGGFAVGYAGYVSGAVSTVLEHHALYVETHNLKLIFDFNESGLQPIHDGRDLQFKLDSYEAKGTVTELEVPEGLTW